MYVITYLCWDEGYPMLTIGVPAGKVYLYNASRLCNVRMAKKVYCDLSHKL